MEMDCSVSVIQSPNSSLNKETDKVSMPSSSKESPAYGDNPTDGRFDSNRSSMVPPVVNSKDIKDSVNETLNSAMSDETNNVSIPSASEESPVIAGNPFAKISLDSGKTPIELPEKNSQDIGVSVNETLNSATSDERYEVSFLSFSQGSPAGADKPVKSSLDSDQSSMELLVTDFQHNSISTNETLNSVSSSEMEKVSMPISSKGSPVNTDNPIDGNSLESDQSLLAPPSDSQDISVSADETLNSPMSNGTDKVSMRSSSAGSLVIADHRIVENSLDSDQSSIVLPKINSQDIDVLVSETLNSASSNEMDKVSMPSSSKVIPVDTDNPIDKNSLKSDQSSLAPPSDSQDISVSADETLNSPMSNGTDKVSMRSSSAGSLVIADHRIVENSLDSDQSSIVLPKINSQDIYVLVSETLNSASSNEMDKVSMPSSSKVVPVDTDNPIDKNSLESDRSSLAPPSINSQDISVSVNETLNSATWRSSSEETLVIADDQLVENSLDSVQSYIVLPETNYRDIYVSVSETLNSLSHVTDKVSNSSYSKNSLDSDQSSTAPTVTKSRDIVSKDNFYDCQDRLGSDSDDDFFSVKGDYSDSWNRQSSVRGSPQVDEISDFKLEPYTTDVREKSVELFHDRFSRNQVDDHKSMQPTIHEKKGKSKQEPSPIGENKKLAELLLEPFGIDHAKGHYSTAPISNETKLVEFFQDSQWSREIASARATRSPSTRGGGKLKSDIAACHLSPKDGTSTETREHSRTLYGRARYITGNLKRENTARANCCFPSWSPSPGSRERKRQTPPGSQT